jgi:hypothetical protein
MSFDNGAVSAAMTLIEDSVFLPETFAASLEAAGRGFAGAPKVSGPLGDGPSTPIPFQIKRCVATCRPPA